MSLQLIDLETHHRDAASPPPQHDLLQVADVVAFISFALRHKYRILLGLIIAGSLAAFYCYEAPPLYESTAKLLVVKKSPLAVEGQSAVSPNTDAMSTHVALISSPWLASRVLANPNIQSMELFASAKDPARALIKALVVEHENKDDAPFTASNILKLSLQGPCPAECAVLLDAVIDAYRKYLEDSNRNVNQDALALITQKAEQINQELNRKEADHEAFRAQVSLLDDNQGKLDYIRYRMAQIDNSLLSLRTRRAETESRLAALRNRSAQGEVELRGMLPESFKPERSELLEQKLLDLLVEEKKISKDFGSGHPRVQSIAEEIALTRDLLSKSSQVNQLAHSTPSNTTIASTDPVGEYIKALEQELSEISSAEEWLKQSEQQLTAEADHERAEAAELARLELKDQQYRNAITRDQQYHDALITQLQGVDIGMATSGYQTTTIAPPDNPRQISPNLPLVLAVAVVAGLLIGFTHACVAEVSDRSFHSPRDLSHSLRLPVLGQIPPVHITGKERKRGGRRLTRKQSITTLYNWAESETAEAYRGLRTALFFKTRQQRLQVIQITSPNAGDGKTTVAINLATSLALSGKRVLLVDADLHNPRIASVLGLTADSGLAAVLSGEIDLCDAIQPSQLPELSVLPCGVVPAMQTDLIASPRLKELIDLLRDRYDYVLIDTPALLTATDSQIVAAQADGVLLAIQQIKNGRPDAVAATEMLRLAGANILGVVLTTAEHAVGHLRTVSIDTRTLPAPRPLAKCGS